MLDESMSPGSRMANDEAVAEQKKNISEIWAQFCSMDPEHFIWGIDPNDTPPEVVIKRVVFAPKKNRASAEDDKSGKKRKKSKGNKEERNPQERRDEERNKSCAVM